jgi:hypothetical protein
MGGGEMITTFYEMIFKEDWESEEWRMFFAAIIITEYMIIGRFN